MTSWFRVGVAVVLLVAYSAIVIASIIATSVPFATFDTQQRGSNDNPTLSLWRNCTHINATDCTGITYYCSRSRERFDVARAFSILTIFSSALAVLCAAVAMGQILCFSDIEAGVRALQSSVRLGLATLVFSIISVAMLVVLSTEPLCEGFGRIENMDGWTLGGGAVSAACCACFALVGSCFGRIMESKISTSKLGV